MVTDTTVFSRLSTHPGFRAQFFWQKLGFILYLFEHIMHSYLTWMHEIFTLYIHSQFVNVSLKRLKRSSQFIIHMLSFCLNIGAKQLVVDVNLDNDASKPLKSIALSNSRNVPIGWISSWIGGFSICIVSITFQIVPLLTSYSRPNTHLLGTFGLLNFTMISHRWVWSSGLPQVSSFSCCDSSNKRV